MEAEKSKFKDLTMYLWIFSLTIIAGYINAVGLMHFNLPITYVSGKIAQMAVGTALGEWNTFFLYFMLIFCFFSGSLVSGVIFSKQRFQLRLRYGFLLILYGIVVTITSFYFKESSIMAFILAFIVGSQNGFFLYWRGAIVRTAHMTGYLSDAGVIYGRALRGNRVNLWKAVFYSFNILAFFLGGVFGAYMTIHYIDFCYIMISLLYMIAAVEFFVIRKQHENESKHFYK